MPHEFLPQPGDLFWTPADWAWAGGLLNVLLPALHYGVPVVAQRFEKFDPEEAFALMARIGVRNAFIPPTALRMLRSAPPPQAGIRLRSVGSGGEALGAETYEWGKRRSASRSTSSTARPNATWCWRPARRSACRGRRDRQAGARPRRRGDPAGRRAVRAGRDRPDRGAAARSR